MDRSGPTLPILLILAACALGYVACDVERHTIAVVEARHLLPRWDLATHLGHGWMDYQLLATGQIHRLLWDLWLQGYWPPALSLYQIPFYLLLGGRMSAGLWSSLIAFVLVGATGSAILWRLWRSDAVLPVCLFLALLMTSPYLLAYASVTMTETLGALVQLFVLLSYLRYRQTPGPRSAQLFALSLTVLFFTKYNYFFLLVGPLAIFEWLDQTSAGSVAGRLESVWSWTRRALSSPTVMLVALYIIGLLIIVRTGGFDVRAMGRRVSVHTIGNSGHVVLYLLLARVWYLHRRGRIDWNRAISADPRVRPLLIWFLVPVTIWLASPYPNHIRDFANLVINRPLGESTVGGGVAIYVDALRSTYFFSEWVLALVVAVFIVAVARYRHQPAVMQWLILAIPIQFAAITLHQTRFPRFLLLTVVLLCLAASSEVGRWCAGWRRARIVLAPFAVLVLAVGALAAGRVVTENRFREVAFENYTDNNTLRQALDSIRAELNARDRLAVVGQSNELSPALLRWELGPPAGASSFPFELGGARGQDLAVATKVLLILPLDSTAAPLDITASYLTQRDAVLERVNRGAFVLRRQFAVPDMHIVLRLYEGRASSSAATRSVRPGCDAPAHALGYSFSNRSLRSSTMKDLDNPAALSLYERLLAAWNARHADDFAALFFENGSAIGYDGSLMTGRLHIASTLRDIFSNHPTASYVAKVREVRTLRPGVVLLRSAVGMVPPGKAELNPSVNALQSVVMVGDGGEMQIALLQNTPAAFHGRPELAEALTRELTEALQTGRIVNVG